MASRRRTDRSRFAKEAAKAAAILGVKRRMLDLPNRMVDASGRGPHKVAGVIREHQASIGFLPYFEDAHPDHIATTSHRGGRPLRRQTDEDRLAGGADLSKWLFYYYCTHLRHVANPVFLLDITGFEAKKHEAIVAYHSQFVVPEKNRKVLEWVDAAGVYFGSRIGTAAAEPFFTRSRLGWGGLESLT